MKLLKRIYWNFRSIGWNWWWFDLCYGIANLIKWFPTIWADRDWDYNYWLKLNLKKLKNMEYNIRNNGNHVRAEWDADKIHLAVLALERLIADDYCENAFINHDKTYGKLKMDLGPPCSKGTRLALFSRVRAASGRQQHYERKASLRLHRHSDYMRKQDIEYANKIISTYLFHWWD